MLEVDEEGLETHYSYDEMNRLVKQWQVKDGTVLNVEKTAYSYEDVDIYTGAETETLHNAFVTTVKTLDPSGGLLGSNVTAEEKTYQNALGQIVREVKKMVSSQILLTTVKIISSQDSRSVSLQIYPKGC